MEVADRLRVVRKKLGFTQSEFAQGLGLKQGSYSDIERGRIKNFSESLLMLLELNFGINPRWVLHEEGDQLLERKRQEGLPADDKSALLEKLKEKDVIIDAQKKKIQSLEKRIEEIRDLIKH
jgi:transcriptional regulator with XRE-family HTH domain